MRTNGMFYKGFHPIEQDRLPDGSDWAPHRPHQACAVRYMLRDLRYAVKNKGVDDPLGPGCDMDQFARQLDWLKHDVSCSPVCYLELLDWSRLSCLYERCRQH